VENYALFGALSVFEIFLLTALLFCKYYTQNFLWGGGKGFGNSGYFTITLSE